MRSAGVRLRYRSSSNRSAFSLVSRQSRAIELMVLTSRASGGDRAAQMTQQFSRGSPAAGNRPGDRAHLFEIGRLSREKQRAIYGLAEGFLCRQAPDS